MWSGDWRDEERGNVYVEKNDMVGVFELYRWNNYVFVFE